MNAETALEIFTTRIFRDTRHKRPAQRSALLRRTLRETDGPQRGLPLRQASEQYFTSSQTRSHLRRHTNGRPQTGQRLLGRSRLATVLPLPFPGALRMGEGELPSAAAHDAHAEHEDRPGEPCNRRASRCVTMRHVPHAQALRRKQVFTTSPRMRSLFPST